LSLWIRKPPPKVIRRFDNPFALSEARVLLVIGVTRRVTGIASDDPRRMRIPLTPGHERARRRVDNARNGAVSGALMKLIELIENAFERVCWSGDGCHEVSLFVVRPASGRNFHTGFAHYCIDLTRAKSNDCRLRAHQVQLRRVELRRVDCDFFS
jgi:hypothetical protein